MGILVALLVLLQNAAAPDCPDAQTCQQAALEAAARQDYETFHDLAWRAVQKGKRNDPDLMYVLARAQSLSGRPGDALVMLERLAGMRVVTDADTNDDFGRVRNLPGWKDLVEAEAALRATSSGAVGPPEPRAPRPRASTPAATRDVGGRSDPAFAPAGVTAAIEEPAIAFTTPPFDPAGLAYDAVSRRFILGERSARKLVVIDEPSHHVANLAAEHSAGFGDITAIEIDKHEGDLWVSSIDASSSTLHKLQLVSGRVIYPVTPPADAGRVRLVDLAVTPHSTILALDAEGRRLFALTPKSHSMNAIVSLDVDGPASVAPADDRIAYVSHEAGIERVDLASRAVSPVKAPRDLDITRLRRIRMHRGALIGVQQTSDGADRAVRVRLNRSGTAAIAVEVLKAPVAATAETTASIDGDVLYYLGQDGGSAAVWRVRLGT